MINRALRLIRQFHEVKQFELANRLGISTSYLSEIESGKKPISFELLERYSDEFDIPTSSLVFFSESLHTKGSISEKVKSSLSEKILSIMEWFIEKNNAKEKEA